MAPELQYREVNEKLFYNTNFPYKEISVILNTGPSIFRNIVVSITLNVNSFIFRFMELVIKVKF